MFRPMRRSKQQLSHEECVQILEKRSSGVLAVLGDEGYPYAVPLSYVYHEGRLYFHGAKTGHKLDAIRNYEKASFCVVDQDEVVPEKYTTHFRSVIAFGRAQVMEDPGQILEAIHRLAKKYAPTDTAENRRRAIDSEIAGMAMFTLDIEHLSGKEAVELMRQRSK